MHQVDAPMVSSPRQESEYVDIGTPIRPEIPEVDPGTPSPPLFPLAPRSPESPFVAKEIETTPRASLLRRLRHGP